MNTLSPKVLLEGLVFPEGPRWHDGKLWFSDMFSNRVMTVDPKGRAEVLHTMQGDRPSGIGFLPDGGVLVVAMERRLILRLGPKGTEPTTFVDLSALPSAGINDMVVDGQGRAYVGSRTGPVSAPVPNGEIVLVEPNGQARVVAKDLAFPNGSVITPDGKTFIVGETRGGRLTAFDIAKDGSLSNRRVWAEVDDPDGCCLDSEGAMWIGCPSRQEFLRVRQGGEVTHRIPVLGKAAVACMLGGEGRRTLFLTTSESPEGIGAAGAMVRELREKKVVTDPFGRAKGRIEVVTVDVPGAGWP